jgi:3-hydroxy-3-methylglutaryl CoA synthase
MTTNYCNLNVGCAEVKATITKLEIRHPIGRPKLYLKAQQSGGIELTVNEVWQQNNESKMVTQGLWIIPDTHGNLYSGSTLARLLTSMDLHSIGDLIGKTITLRSKPNGFLCVVM